MLDALIKVDNRQRTKVKSLTIRVVILSKAKDLAMYSAGFFATLKMTFIKVTLNSKQNQHVTNQYHLQLGKTPQSAHCSINRTCWLDRACIVRLITIDAMETFLRALLLISGALTLIG